MLVSRVGCGKVVRPRVAENGGFYVRVVIVVMEPSPGAPKGPATPKIHSRSHFFFFFGGGGISQDRARHCAAAMQNAFGVATTLEFTCANPSHCRAANANVLGVAGALGCPGG